MDRDIDLHVHTTASDGTVSPAGVVKLAYESGLTAIAVTDHDTVAGYEEARRAGRELGVEIVPGIEISTRWNGAIHILGYYIDVNDPELTALLKWMIDVRNERNRKIVQLMAEDGIPITYEYMENRFGTAIGRPHFAEILVDLGFAKDIYDAFDHFVERGQRYYLPKQFVTIEDTIKAIRSAGGIPVLAHPFQYKKDDATLRQLIEYAMSLGLMGIECRYSGYTDEQQKYLSELADEYGLLKTGGSDFHGSHKARIALGSGIGGTLCVPYEYLEGLKAAL